MEIGFLERVEQRALISAKSLEESGLGSGR